MLASRFRHFLSFNLVSCRKMSVFPQIMVLPEPSMFDEPLKISIKGMSILNRSISVLCQKGVSYTSVLYISHFQRPLAKLLVALGLPPSNVVTLYATTSVTRDCIYESYANYKVSSDGTIDVEKNKPLSGSFVGVEPMGLLWAMTPHADSKRKIARFSKTDVTKPQIYHLHVFDEEKQSLEECRNTKKGHILTSTAFNRWFMAPGVRRIPVRENGIVATLFLPPGDGPFPGVINIFGGNPGLLEYKSSLHASHGFAALALAYFGMEHLPSNMLDRLDLEYFDIAVQYMKHHKNVLGKNGIGVYSICKGGQIAIMMATYLKDIGCVVSINGNCCSGVGSFKYKDMLFDRDDVQYEKLDPSKDNDMADLFCLPEVGKMEDYPGFFPFHKRHDVPYMLVAGLSDTSMPSRYFVGEMERLLHEAKHPDFEILKYPDTGHLIEPPNLPYTSVYFQPAEPSNVYLTNGGKLVPHCKNQEDHWPKALDFLKKKLSDDESVSVIAKL